MHHSASLLNTKNRKVLLTLTLPDSCMHLSESCCDPPTTRKRHQPLKQGIRHLPDRARNTIPRATRSTKPQKPVDFIKTNIKEEEGTTPARTPSFNSKKPPHTRQLQKQHWRKMMTQFLFSAQSSFNFKTPHTHCKTAEQKCTNRCVSYELVDRELPSTTTENQ